MSAFLLLIAAAATGIEVGWQPMPEGGYEYTIQIEPELAESFVRGDHEIVSSVPPGIDARRYRIVVGRGKLARVEADAAAAVAARPKPLARRSPPPAQPAIDEPDPPLEPLAQPEPADTPPLAGADTLKNLPEPPDDTGPAMAVPLEPKALADDRPAANPFDRKQQPESEKHVADNAHLPVAETAPMLLKSGYEEATKVNRPPSDAKPPTDQATEPQRPWTAFVLALVLLCCSLGANAYLGWIAWDARARYRSTLSKLGAAGAA